MDALLSAYALLDNIRQRNPELTEAKIREIAIFVLEQQLEVIAPLYSTNQAQWHADMRSHIENTINKI